MCGLTKMAAPMVGPSAGPPTTAMAYKATAVPLASWFQKSPSAAATFETGPEPNKPPKNLVMKKDCALWEAAVPIEKRPRQKTAGRRDNRLPHISEIGAQMLGPNANPMLQRVSHI